MRGTITGRRQDGGVAGRPTVRALMDAVAERDRVTARHGERSSALALLLAREVAPHEAGAPQMALGFLLHDIGKLAVPVEILRKPGPLTVYEAQVMRAHPAAGALMLAGLPGLERAVEVVRHHHERWDGAGYPLGLTGEAIPLWARIFAVADAVDAITSHRPYRPARSLDEALAELQAEAGRQFDPVCAEAFLRLDRRAVAALLEGAVAQRAAVAAA